VVRRSPRAAGVPLACQIVSPEVAGRRAQGRVDEIADPERCPSKNLSSKIDKQIKIVFESAQLQIGATTGN
jgi:hypothetical protein